MSPLEIIKDLKSKKRSEKFTLEFLENEVKNAQGVTDFWKYRLINSYFDLKQYQQ